jgi:uncharacterized protein YlaI
MRGMCPDPEDEKRRRVLLSLTKLNERNPNWKGSDPVAYETIHEWAKRRVPKPDLCVCCKAQVPFDLANISQRYLRDASDWEWLCRRCHMTKDGRIQRRSKNGKFSCNSAQPVSSG